MARARNTDVIEFTSPTGDWSDDPSWFGLFTQLSGGGNSNVSRWGGINK